jgi:hypothetical protein
MSSDGGLHLRKALFLSDFIESKGARVIGIVAWPRPSLRLLEAERPRIVEEDLQISRVLEAERPRVVEGDSHIGRIVIRSHYLGWIIVVIGGWPLCHNNVLQMRLLHLARRILTVGWGRPDCQAQQNHTAVQQATVVYHGFLDLLGASAALAAGRRPLCSTAAGGRA